MDENQLLALFRTMLAAQQQNGGGSGIAYRAPVASVPTAYYGHGNGGLFSNPATERPLISAVMMPESGLVSLLPAPRGSVYTDPLYGIITGVTATTGSEPNGVCDDPPVAGLLKLCEHSAPFGRFSRRTRVFDVDRIGALAHRGEHMDFNIVGGPQDATNWLVPSGLEGLGQAANSEFGKAMFELAVTWARDFAHVIYDGDPTNNTGGGGYREFWGLDTLINTGYRDAETGVACPAADSLVFSFGQKSLNTNGNDAVRAITALMRNLRYNAERMGLLPARWALAMRWGLFYELTEIWPCAYVSARCTPGTGTDVMVSANEQIAMRDDMRNGNYLMVDGMRIPVAIDEAITETEPDDGIFQSSIYFVPLTVVGNFAATYLEYFNYDSPRGTMAAINDFGLEGYYRSSDNGRFLIHSKPPTNFCIELLAKTQPRLVLRTPMLAGRLTHVRYVPLYHERESFTDSAYFVDGGKTSRIGYGPSWWSPTA